jgi:hypothetical protein
LDRTNHHLVFLQVLSNLNGRDYHSRHKVSTKNEFKI